LDFIPTSAFVETSIRKNRNSFLSHGLEPLTRPDPPCSCGPPASGSSLLARPRDFSPIHAARIPAPRRFQQAIAVGLHWPLVLPYPHIPFDASSPSPRSVPVCRTACPVGRCAGALRILLGQVRSRKVWPIQHPTSVLPPLIPN
jgi:hypothetical protein